MVKFLLKFGVSMFSIYEYRSSITKHTEGVIHKLVRVNLVKINQIAFLGVQSK